MGEYLKGKKRVKLVLIAVKNLKLIIIVMATNRNLGRLQNQGINNHILPQPTT